MDRRHLKRAGTILLASTAGLAAIAAGVWLAAWIHYDGSATGLVQADGFRPSAAILARDAGGETVLVTHLRDSSRTKRRLLAYSTIPAVLRNAILAIEDHRFFSHGGVDLYRLAGAAADGLREWRVPRGTSTLTQQLAREFYLTPERTYTRKFKELLISLQLESDLTKEQIFEHYCNQIWMGRRGSFDVRGMGEAAHAYFNKDATELTLAEAALLAGLIQRPSYLNPFQHPDRARARRNVVLDAMLRHRYITAAQHKAAVNASLNVNQERFDEGAAPYFVDLVCDRLEQQFNRFELATQGLRVVTTLDPQLQRIAVEVLRDGMANVDRMVARQGRFKGKTPPRAEGALVVLDPATGAVKVVVGGRDYERSQLNRALAKRQPGSAFKPFVYAAALQRREPLAQMTLATILHDAPTEFELLDGEIYQPTNYGNRFAGDVTLREAMRRSLNIPAIVAAQRAGLDRVAELARGAGIGAGIRATSSIALGAYEVTPLDLAGAYTTFANQGAYAEPFFIERVRDAKGNTLHRHEPVLKRILDPRVAYLTNSLMEDVVNRGTGWGVRRMGFYEAAAGKTGTDDDGWFVGYTRNLLCAVWVGFDDNRDLQIEGSRSALPIWTAFMKRAHQLSAYQRPGAFGVPGGIVSMQVDPQTGLAATNWCPRQETEVFIDGTQPQETCGVHREDLAAAAR